MTPDARTGPFRGGLFEAWVGAAYDRWGLRGSVLYAMAGASAFTLPWSIVAVAMAVVVTGGSAKELAISIALNVGLATLGLTAALVVELRELRRIDAWNAQGRSPDQAAEMLRLVVTAPVRWTNFGIATYLVTWIPVFTWWFTELSGSLAFGLLLVAGGIFVATPVVWPVAVFTQELAHRPLLAQLWAEFPDLEPPRRRGQSIRTRAILPVPLLTLSTGYSVGLYVTGVDDPLQQISVAIVGGFGFTAIYALLLRFAMTEATLRPIDDLVDGVERFAAGDLGSRIPITSSDEFATLGRAFNQMAAQLVDHRVAMRESRARMVAAADESRRRVEQALHDGAQQYLVLVGLRLRVLEKAVASRPKAAAMVADAQGDLGHVLSELHDIAHGLYPPVLLADGLPAALTEAGRRSVLPATVLADSVGRSAPDVEAAVYFACLEAMQNAGKHAGEDAHITVTLDEYDGQLRFSVADDGNGYDSAAISPHAGMQNMADRIGALGGWLEVVSTAGVGTTVSGVVGWGRHD